MMRIYPLSKHLKDEACVLGSSVTPLASPVSGLEPSLRSAEGSQQNSRALLPTAAFPPHWWEGLCSLADRNPTHLVATQRP